MTSVDDEARRRAQRAEQVALRRYQLIRDAADPQLSTKDRGRRQPTAFCAGLRRPRIFVTAGTAALSPDELDAVLIHEQTHARRRDPLRRLVASTAADVLFFVPVATWWRERRQQDAELRADRSAISRLGRVAVAGAMMAMAQTHPSSAATAPAGATFDCATQARSPNSSTNPPPGHCPPPWPWSAPPPDRATLHAAGARATTSDPVNDPS